MKTSSRIVRLIAALSRRRDTREVTLRLHVVDDPDGVLRIVATTGRVDDRTVGELVRLLSEDGPWCGLHLDLGDSQITSAHALCRLEAAVDQLEFSGIAVRIVGLDPSHPALTQ